MPPLTIRQERHEDHREAEFLTREAFWNRYQPGCEEHLLLHRMRDVPAFVPELALVAVEDGTLVGHVAVTEARIVDDDRDEVTVLCLGPIAVHPGHQGRGIGTALMEGVLERARELGYRAVLLFGDPGYYARFGFRSTGRYGIGTSTGDHPDALMARELVEGGLAGVHGRFHIDPVFEIDADELAAFDQRFPPKEKLVTDTQLPQGG